MENERRGKGKKLDRQPKERRRQRKKAMEWHLRNEMINGPQNGR